MANGTPESEFSIECFQNYSAGEVFVQGLAGVVDQTDVETLIRAQKTMLQRFEKTNEMLTNCNVLSANRLKVASQEFKRHTQLLLEMKKDLEHVFKKIRAIKTKLSSQYPEAYKTAVAASFERALVEEDEEGVKPIGAKVGCRTTASKLGSRMVSTVSTETLKPSSSVTDEREKSRNRPDAETPEGKASENLEGVQKEKSRNSSSSDTESEASSGDSSTDTG